MLVEPQVSSGLFRAQKIALLKQCPLRVNISLSTLNLCHYKKHPSQAEQLISSHQLLPNIFLSRVGRGRRLSRRERGPRRASAGIYHYSFPFLYLTFHHPHHNTRRLSSYTFLLSIFSSFNLLDKISRIYSLPPPVQDIYTSQELFIDF